MPAWNHSSSQVKPTRRPNALLEGVCQPRYFLYLLAALTIAGFGLASASSRTAMKRSWSRRVKTVIFCSWRTARARWISVLMAKALIDLSRRQPPRRPPWKQTKDES